MANELRFVGGELLFVDGDLAMSEDCCCGGVDACAMGLSAFRTAYRLNLKLGDGTFGNDPGCCGIWEVGASAVTMDIGGTFPDYTHRQAELEGCGGAGLVYAATEIECVSGSLVLSAGFLWDATPTWQIRKSNYTLPNPIVLGTWYDMGAGSVSGPGTGSCHPSAGTHIYAQFVTP